jgi:polysaccharide deacetylase family protein (PEP-CTERM system associated)
LNPLLELLNKHKITATFAVLGKVAKEHPRIISQIHENGHEIASHSWSHKTLYELGPLDFEDEISRSIDLLSSITGERPLGFRAPSFSINENTKWAFKILEKYKFEYDASIFPIKTMLYGVPGAPLQIYKPSREDITKNDPNGKIVEFPMTVLKIGKNIPISGGFYFRFLPLWFLKYGIKRVNQERPAILYIHPWEVYSQTIRLDLPCVERLITYYGINSSLRKLEELVNEFEFTTIQNVLAKSIID